MPEKYTDILVGGGGFIGSALGEKLVRGGETVLSISRSLGELPAGVTGLSLDVKNGDALQAGFPEGENVFILIGQNNANFSVDEELQNLKNLIEVLNQKKPKKVLYFSSALVYGECIDSASESDAVNPVDEYSRFKRSAEDLLKKSLDPSISLGILRLTNVYGGPKNRGFIGLIMRQLQATDNKKIIINGDGRQERDYIFLDDLVAAVLAVRDGLEENDVVNIATGKSHTLIELVETVSQATEKPIGYEVNGKTLAEVVKSRISNEKLQKKYGFTVNSSLQDGLKKTADRYREESVSVAKIQTPQQPVKKRLLLLGGEGFIGRNIASYFGPVTSCFSVGRRRSLFPDRSDTFIRVNPYRDRVSGEHDVVIHLIDNKVSAKSIAKEETKLMRNLTLHPKSHLIVFSSAAVYVNPDSQYGLRKIALENFYQDFCKKNNILLTIFRPFNIYGTFQIPFRQGGLVANLIYSHFNGKATEINDMGANRDFMFVKDIPRFVEKILDQKKEGIFDLGSGKLTSVRELISALENRVLKEKIRIIEKNNRETIGNRTAEGDLLESLSMVGFEEGLAQTAGFYRQNMALVERCVKMEKI